MDVGPGDTVRITPVASDDEDDDGDEPYSALLGKTIDGKYLIQLCLAKAVWRLFIKLTISRWNAPS